MSYPHPQPFSLWEKGVEPPFRTPTVTIGFLEFLLTIKALFYTKMGKLSMAIPTVSSEDRQPQILKRPKFVV
ncbi:hypothetical protein WA1_22580 [Scytonema hofmannii PCC 7110]|uniref:Uncharacterized protein n=1 Tax=Scytonema hofmannii PCC 7110 TaxID=128403 RepID=A0A139X964_9CYAN|nr:hypothetical protein [Scytonema hofmannii]KYC41254.1 hypothetical protein WA1_22580 [Scytonema hofmannii PCC 7110]